MRRKITFEPLESRLLLSAGLETGTKDISGDVWQMAHHDMWNTNQADYSVPAERLDDSFFDFLAWQKQSPDGPGDLGGSSMPFYDGAGPEGADVILGTYHWPKGVQAMDRHTGELFWAGNPSGGESIGELTPAFSNDGSTVYVLNDANGNKPLMAFDTIVGPSVYWHNGADSNPEHFAPFSPNVAPDGRIFGHQWNGSTYGATDTGTALTETWAASSDLSSCYSSPALYEDEGELIIVATGRAGSVAAFEGEMGYEIWNTFVGAGTDADPTIDPDTGNIYCPVGSDSISVVGLDIYGEPLWSSESMPVFDYVAGTNNPQRAQATGCLSHDGATFYFQTNSTAGDGRLYAINTTDGSVKWSFETHSQGWERASSSPIVTENGVVIVGNNEGDTYYAILDDGTEGVLLDTLAVDPDGVACASATLSSDGLLYLPLRVVQTVGATGESPTFAVENVYSAIDLTEDAAPVLSNPASVRALARNDAVLVKWEPIVGMTEYFDYYAVYRATEPFSSIDGMLPVGTVSSVTTSEYLDETASNGTAYYYAVTTVSTTGTQESGVVCTEPRTPYDETDLQVVSIAREQYPRFLATYEWQTVTESGGYGPYSFSAATGLAGGQTFETQRFPDLGESVTYTATIRNRGTNVFSGPITATWTVGETSVTGSATNVTLAPGETATYETIVIWTGDSVELVFEIDLVDARADNNSLTSDAMAVPFLTYIDESFIENFRDVWSPTYAGAETDDAIDWLNRHMERFNEMFEDAGCDKRVHYNVLEVLEDTDPDPSIDTTPYAIFPFRYYFDSSDPRTSGYYRPATDIDDGLLHEMGHQLGLIDLYQLDVPASANQVSGQGYSAVNGLMRTCASYLSEHSALAMNHWFDDAHGYFGQYLFCLPENLQLQILDRTGSPLEGATVRVYQYCERPGEGKVITDQVKFQGLTDADGRYTLPNVPIDPVLIPEVGTGDVLSDNPFGYVDCVGRNGVFLIGVEFEGQTKFCWLDITEANVAYWHGETETAVFERQLGLGGPVQVQPPQDITEMNAADWEYWVEGDTGALSDDTLDKTTNRASIRFDTNGGFDNYVRYPATYSAQWDLTQADTLFIDLKAENPNLGFQNASPWIRLNSADGSYFEYRYYVDGHAWDVLTECEEWTAFEIPLDANASVMSGWRRTTLGTPDMTNISSIEIHADTWDYGFTMWVDNLHFDLPSPALPGDLNGDGLVGSADLDIVRGNWGAFVAAGDLLAGDPSGDGLVGSADLDIVRGGWGTTAAASAESNAPSTAVVGPQPRPTSAGGSSGDLARAAWVWELESRADRESDTKMNALTPALVDLLFSR